MLKLFKTQEYSEDQVKKISEETEKVRYEQNERTDKKSMIGPDKAAAQTGRSHRKRRHSKESDVTRGGA